MFTIRTHRLLQEKKKQKNKPKMMLFHALLVIKGVGKPLITTNKLAGPVGGLAPTPPFPLSKPIKEGFQHHLYAQGDATRPPINFWSGRFVKQGLQVAARALRVHFLMILGKVVCSGKKVTGF